MKDYEVDINDFKIKIDNLDVVDNSIVIYGSFANFFKKGNFFFSDDKHNKYEVEYLDSDTKNNMFFYISINMNNIKYLVPTFEIKDENYVVKIDFGINSKLNNIFASLYLNGTNNIVKYNKLNNRFDIYKNNIFNITSFELKCIYFLLKKHKFKNLLIREWINICSFFKSREVWLITDRSNYANDNGEEFFKYVINEELNPDTKYYFAIDKKSCDYKRLHYNYSNVININSLRYKLLFLNSDKVISSYMDNININPFGNDKKYLADLYRHKLVFLQHRNNLKNLIYSNLNIDMISTNTLDECNYLSNNMIKKDIVKLTGFSRNNLGNNIVVKKQVLILSNLMEENSECFQFYNRLINDERILSIAKEKGYKIRIICNNSYDFNKNDMISFGKRDIIYNNELNSSKLLITDNKDLALDFAYLRRLAIYNSFNKENVDIFGIVCNKYESLVKEIIKAIKNDCLLEKKYLKKIDKYFMYSDNENNKRIFDEIVKLK